MLTFRKVITKLLKGGRKQINTLVTFSHIIIISQSFDLTVLKLDLTNWDRRLKKSEYICTLSRIHWCGQIKTSFRKLVKFSQESPEWRLRPSFCKREQWQESIIFKELSSWSQLLWKGELEDKLTWGHTCKVLSLPSTAGSKTAWPDQCKE